MISSYDIGLATSVDAQTIALISRNEIEQGLRWSWTPPRVRRAIEDRETNVVVGAGETKEVTLEPEKRPALTSRWWFWTGVGVVVVAGATVTYALLTSKPADKGDQFQPGQVSAPLMHW